jgi:hypothetical protein
MQIFFGNIHKNEKKYINLSGKIIISPQTLTIDFPLFDGKD